MKRDPLARGRPGTTAGLLWPLVRVLDWGIAIQKAGDPFQRDPRVVRLLYPLIKAVNLYFGTEIRGWKNVPPRGPFLIVGNHSGGAEPNDVWFLAGKWVEERGPAAPLYALAYDLLFSVPPLGAVLSRLGVVPANHGNARKALKKGAAVVLFPGGDYEVFRPWSERNRIDFGGRTGFIELAISMGVPVVPMTIHGAHQSTFTLTRGRWIAQLMGIDRLHVNVFPLIWNIPFGLTPAFVPSVQVPAKVRVQIGKPLDWSHYGPKHAKDPVVRRRCYAQITRVMQRTLTQLARENPHPILTRLDELRPSRLLPGLAEALAARRR